MINALLAAIGRLRLLLVRRRSVVIFAGAGEGSSGDQAMLDAFRAEAAARGWRVAVAHLTRIDGQIETQGSIDHLTRVGPRPRNRVLAALFHFGLIRAARYERFAVMGADVIDGAYSADEQMTRLKAYDALLRLGLKGAVLGFSVSLKPDEKVLRKLASPDLSLFARDPLSSMRFQQATGRSPDLAADIAFLLRSAITSSAGASARDWIAARKKEGDFVLAVNISGHSMQTVGGDGAAVHAAFLSSWLAADAARSVILIPHDVRAPYGDVEIAVRCRDLITERHPDRFHCLSPPLNAWEVKHLTGMANLVLTGRMHLAIASLGMGTPPLCTVYKDKFEGLFEHFEIDGLTIEPADVMDKQAMLARLDEATARLPELREKIQAKLPEVKALAQRNLDWLD